MDSVPMSKELIEAMREHYELWQKVVEESRKEEKPKRKKKR